ncbi:MAG: oligosaccharide flippase family protein [Clostridiales bacterium]|nr:oligosaccharide flippase family protein [Clostridiales bacterium]
MNSYKRLISNSFMFGVGNLGSKLISFILVPLYTYYLSTEQFGTADLIMTTATMLTPIISASIFEAVFRFVLDKNRVQDIIITNSVFIALIGFIIVCIIYPLLSFFNVFGDNLIYFYLILLVRIFEQVFALYAKGLGKVKVFAINGMLLTFTTGALSILFLVYLDFGIAGYFWAIIVSNAISIVFLNIMTKGYKSISLSKFDRKIMKELLNFSVPMIPNSIMWSLMNTFSRYFILFFAGISANGLFAVASKIPVLINLISQVFLQAWQISAIEEYDSNSKSTFYSNVFTHLSSTLFIGVSVSIVVIKIIFGSFFAAEYFSAWMVVPFLLLGTVFSSFSTFLGTNYIAAKQTKGVFKTSIYGGVISTLLNLILIPFFGIVGAGISSMLSFFTVFIIRFYDTKKYIDMNIKWSVFTSSLIIIFVQIGVLMVSLPKTAEFVVESVLLLILAIINRHLFTSLYKLKQINRKKSV